MFISRHSSVGKLSKAQLLVAEESKGLKILVSPGSIPGGTT